MHWNLEIICLDIQRCPTIPTRHPTRTIRALSRSQKHVDIAHIKQTYNSNEMPVPHPQPRACFAFHVLERVMWWEKSPCLCVLGAWCTCVFKNSSV
jgi:hypothetical protein